MKHAFENFWKISLGMFANPSCLFVLIYWPSTLFSSDFFLLMLFTVLHISFWNYLFKSIFIFRLRLESSSKKSKSVRGTFFAFKSKEIQFPFYFWKTGKIRIFDLKQRALFLTLFLKIIVFIVIWRPKYSNSYYFLRCILLQVHQLAKSQDFA